MLAGTTCKEVKMSRKHFLNIAGFAAAALALAFAVLTLQAAGVQSSTSNLYSFADLSQLDGQSVLVRNDNGVNVTVQAQDLTPGEAITLMNGTRIDTDKHR
jgi:secreted PhoX family phosphatase